MPLIHPDIKTIHAPDAVFWDWDGTLVDSYGFLNDAHNHTLQALGFEPFQPGEYREYFGKPRDYLYPKIYKDKAAQAVEIFGRYVEQNAHNVKHVPESEDALSLLKSRNIPMGIVSNKKSEIIERELYHLQWEHYFPSVIGAGEADEDKPSAAPLQMAMDRVGLSPTKHVVWYVGDTENDLACAQAAGCPALFLTGHADTEKLIKKYEPFLCFDNYSQLKEFLVAI